MRRLLLAALAGAIPIVWAVMPANAVPARPLPPSLGEREAIVPVHGRIHHGFGYRYASPYRSYGFPRLYYYPWGVPPRSYLRHRRWWHR